MTNREFLTAIAALETAPEDIRAYAVEKLAKLDATNEARKNKPSKAAIENAPLLAQIYDEVLGTEVKTAANVAEAIGVSVQKASNLCRTLVTAGKATVTDVKVPGKGTCKGYVKVDAE